MRTLLALFAALLLLSVGPGATASTSTPPRNGLIALNGPEGIYIVDPRAGTTNVLPESATMADPTWSPDGTLLAGSSSAGETSNVYTIKPDGTERTLVVENADSPSWSPDGKQLVVVRGEWSGSQLVVVRADGTDEHVLEPDGRSAPTYVSSPAWSPDGSQIAFIAGDGRVFLITPDGEKLHAIDIEGGGPVSWSPDSSRLAFDRVIESKDGGRQVVVVHDLATGKERLLTGEQDGALAPTWSPEGDQLAFLSTSERKTSTTTTTTTHSCGGEPSVSHLWAMSPDGMKAHKVAEGEFYGTPSWGRESEASPAPAPVADEQPVPAPAPSAEQEPAPAADVPAPASEPPSKPAQTSRPTPVPEKKTELPSVTKGLLAVRGSNGIYLVNPDSAAAHKVPDTADMIAPYWSPDGSLLAVERVGTDGSSSIYTIRPDGTHPQLVLKNASAPSWTPAGDRILVLRNECSTPCEPEDDEANVLYSVRPDGSDLQPVDATDSSDLYEARELAWRTDGSPIWFFDDGSANAPGSFDTSAAAWSPDESRIAFIGALKPTDDEASGDAVTAGLWIVSAEGGTPQLLLEGASGRPAWPY